MTTNRRRIVSVNTSDTGGGAERTASLLHEGYRQRGWDAWLLVGDKQGDDDRTMLLHTSPHIDYQPFARALPTGGRAVRKGMAALTGVEDHVFPYSHRVLEATGAHPHIVHLHNLHGPYFDLRAVAPLTRRVPVVLTLHDSWLFTGHCAMPAGCERWVAGCGRCPDLDATPSIRRDATRLNHRRKGRWLRPATLRVAVPSSYLFDRLNRSLLADAVLDARVIRYGIDLETFVPGDKGEARQRIGLPADELVLVFVAIGARTSGYKDHPTVLAAASAVASAVAPAGRSSRLVVLGDGGPTEHFGDLTVEHRGLVPPAVVAEYLRAADVCVHAAREETFGIALLEALACGTPVAATSVGGVPEALAGYGQLAPAGDPRELACAIHRALATPEPARSAAMAYVRRRHGAPTMVSSYLEWFDELLAASAPISAATGRPWGADPP